MKRITFVFIGILAITGIVLLSQKKIDDMSVKIVKADVKKHHARGLFD
jgi:hypothetical protein